MEKRTPSPHVQQKRQRRVEQILDVSMGVLGAEGIEAVSVHRVARELNLTVGALYRYFESKDALVVALWRRAVEAYKGELLSVQRALEERASEPVGPLTLVVAAALEYQRQSMLQPARFYFIMLALTRESVLLPVEHRPVLMGELFGLLQSIESPLAMAVESGTLHKGSARERTISLWAGLNGALSLGKLGRTDPKEIPTGHLVEELLRSLLCTWGADPEVVKRVLREGRTRHSRIEELN